MSHSVPIELPQGFGATTPNLSLSYSSGAPSHILGMGWSISIPSVERMTYRGLPDYDSDDDFCANGGEQLVRLPGTQQYRARFEGGFVRYSWLEEGDGSGGYWLAEYPDGTKGYFGATADGTLVPEARVGDEEGTFRYMLVEKVDLYGHRERWTYQKFGHHALPVHVGYVFSEGNPQYEVLFTYEERRDPDGLDLISDATPGFNMVLSQRLTQMAMRSRGVQIRSYDFSYVPFSQSAGITLLERVERRGLDGSVYPIVNSFSYSKNLGHEDNRPFIMDMGQVQASFATRTSQLIDINGDALPDIITSTTDGPHQFFLNVPDADRPISRFNPSPVPSAVGTRSGHNLAQATVQVLDVNGDGFTDLLNATTGEVLVNKGEGDWLMADQSPGTSELAQALLADFDASDGELQALRFMDINNDRRIDLLQASSSGTSIYLNMGEEGFELADGAQPLEAGFVENNLELADMNGDGLLDVIQMQVGAFRFRLNHGRGRWGEWVNISGLDLTDIELENAELQDLNGDALDDIVVVVGTSVSIALNDNARGFDPLITYASQDVEEGDIPQRTSTTTVLFADMNGNGSTDVVWIEASGQVTALELFPLRPNLMTQHTNGIGAVTEVAYETAAQQMAKDGGRDSWPYAIPFPMNVVIKLDQYDLLTELHEVTTYRYHEGFYDGQEKQFRGFALVQTTLEGNETIEEGLTEERFDVGVNDTYYHGRLLSSSVSSGGRELSESLTTYSDCPLDGIPAGTELPIRFICT
ncbi:MAG: toxin TcdB middle/N-terminal domain-containing protein, partial [Myxococcota bacterium]